MDFLIEIMYKNINVKYKKVNRNQKIIYYYKIHKYI